MKKRFGFILLLTLSIMLLAGLTAINAESMDSEKVVITEEAGVDKESVKGTVIGYVGDNDGNDTVNIKDATNIQKHLADIVTMNENSVLLSDVDDNGAVNIKDSTTIQKFIAGIPVDAIVNHLMYVPEGSTSNEHAHNYSSVTVAPTCTEKGYTEYTCACGDSYKDNFVDPTDHKYEDGICSVCGAKEPHVHSYATVIVAPTCTEKGYTEYTCACGDSYKDNWTATYGYHNFENYECTACGISPFDYYAEWIKENGIISGNRFEYTFSSIYDIEGTENLDFEVYYYPEMESIAFSLYNFDNRDHTMIFLDKNEASVFCRYGNSNYDCSIITYIDITTFTSNTTIQPELDSTYTSNNQLELARQNICLSISAHGYCLECEVDGLSLYDLGFYSFLK